MKGGFCNPRYRRVDQCDVASMWATMELQCQGDVAAMLQVKASVSA